MNVPLQQPNVFSPSLPVLPIVGMVLALLGYVAGSTEAALLILAISLAIAIRQILQHRALITRMCIGRASEEVERRKEQAILESMAEGVCIIDHDGKLILLNSAGYSIFGISERSSLGRSFREVIQSPTLRDFVAEVMSSAGPLQTEIEDGHGSVRHLRVSGQMMRGARPDEAGIVLVGSDITNVKRLERARSDFIANVSHELRTPVTAIRGFAETLLDGALDSREDAFKFVEIISRQAQRLSQIFDDMLSLSMLEGGRTFEFESRDVAEVVRAAIEACDRKAVARQVRLISDIQPGLLARVNAALIEQALVNLIDNAIKFSREGQAVTISSDVREGKIMIVVRDQGPGIPAHQLARLFERFYRVDQGRTRTEGGTGLGLSIVKHIAQIHEGGSIAVHSEMGKGSEFILSLKASVADA